MLFVSILKRNDVLNRDPSTHNGKSKAWPLIPRKTRKRRACCGAVTERRAIMPMQRESGHLAYCRHRHLLGLAIRGRRRKLGWSQERLAEIPDVHRESAAETGSTEFLISASSPRPSIAFTATSTDSHTFESVRAIPAPRARHLKSKGVKSEVWPLFSGPCFPVPFRGSRPTSEADARLARMRRTRRSRPAVAATARRGSCGLRRGRCRAGSSGGNRDSWRSACRRPRRRRRP